MNIIEAFKKYEKIRRPLWIHSDTYICSKHLFYSYESDPDDLKIYIKRQGREELEPYSLLGLEVMADDWEEYIEKHDLKNESELHIITIERKVIDIFYLSHYPHESINSEQIAREKLGWETLSKEVNKEGYMNLKMVKYETI